MHTGNWWWDVQVCDLHVFQAFSLLFHFQHVLEARKPGATIMPIIISSDRTQVTLFGTKTAYPLYLTIGNLPKAIRCKPSWHGQILLAYLPTTKLKTVTNEAARRRMTLNLFHSCLWQIFKPLENLGIEGIVMKDGNGTQRRVHPILAAFVGDYPEQVLVTCIKSGQCPKCDVAKEHLGQPTSSNARDILAVRYAFNQINDHSIFVDACSKAGIKPVFHPFWKCLPYVDIFQAITPDVLHQLLQGVFKHLMSWLKQAYGAREIDARTQRLIPNHHIRLFSNGITSLSRITGKEHGLISRVILGVIADMRLPSGMDSARLVRATRALLDFMFIAQLPVLSAHHLLSMKKALDAFHCNKQIFVDLGIRDNFNIPKLHSCMHYVASIKLFGTTDNYNTQQTERLHIDYTKEAYRASNMRDEYPQMMSWLERREQIYHHDTYIRRERHDNPDLALPSIPPFLAQRCLKMTRFPTVQSVSVNEIVSKYGATYFYDAFARFVVLTRDPEITRARLERDILNVHIPFRTVSVYHRIRFEDDDHETVDSIHIQPQRTDDKGRIIPGRFDTALVHCGRQNETGIHGAYMLIPSNSILTFISFSASCSAGPRHIQHQLGSTYYAFRAT